MSRVDVAVKIEGPYAHKAGYRCRIVLPTGLRRWCPSSPTREAALEVGRQAAEARSPQASALLPGLARFSA